MCLVLLTGVFALTACNALTSSHTHTEVVDAAVAPTCTEKGLTAGKHCSTCGEITVKQQTIKALGHTEVVDDAVTPTCTEAGLSKGKHCSVCNAVITEQQEIAAYGHKETIKDAVDPTCTTEGRTESRTCSICNAVTLKYEIIPALGHTEVIVPGVAKTCTDSGLTDGKRCSVCNTVTVKQVVIPAGHTLVVDEAVSATCTESGLTEGKHCSECNEIVVPQSVAPATGHSFGDWVITTQPTETEQGSKRRDCANCDAFETDIVAALSHDHSRWDAITLEAVAPTCTTTGLTEGKKCSDCGETYLPQYTVPATGHTYGEWTVTKEPTEDETGLRRRECENCDAFEVEVVDALAHDHSKWGTVVTDAVAPTCTTPGLTEGVACAKCGEAIVPQTTIPATGHTYRTEVVAPTCTEKGYTLSFCDCGASKKSNYVSAKGHTKVAIPAVAATCTETGLTKGEYCTVCETVVTEQTVVSALGHKEVVDAAVTATCTIEGFTAGKHCSVCNTVTEAPVSLGFEPHTYSFMQDPNASGIYANLCTVCYGVEQAPLCYATYGAVGNGVTDDSEAIRKTHNAANYYGLSVEGTKGATYYIGAISQTITIKTNTDWKGATFIFDDSQIMWNDSTLRGVYVFTVAHDDQYLYYDVAIPNELKNNGLKKGQTNIGMTFDEPCMIKIEDKNEKIFIRYSTTNNDNGDYKQEMLYVDENGNIIGTPIQYDYDTITSIRVYSVTDDPITVGNGNIKTIVPDPRSQTADYENNYCFYNRGILVRRSNTTIANVNHTIEGEDMTDMDQNLDDPWASDVKSYGVPYNGFFSFEYVYNVALKDCQVQGHQAYSFYEANGSRNEMGSYDIYAKHCIGLKLLNIDQRQNYGDTSALQALTVITNRFMYHGVMGSYYCRNVVMDGCTIDRFDSHKGLHNATITNSELGFGILVIGGGTLHIENVHRTAGNEFILLREDYNSVFDGDIEIINCSMGSSITTIIRGRYYSDHYCGLPNYMVRNITIDGLTSENTGSGWLTKTCTINIYTISTTTTGKGESNPLPAPESIRVRGVTSKANKTNVNVSSNNVISGTKITSWTDSSCKCEKED